LKYPKNMNRVIKTRIIFTWMILSLNLLIPAPKAQNINQRHIDSLKRAAASDKEDTNKINALNSLAYDLGQNNPSAALSYAESAVVLSQKIRWTKGMANGLVNTGYIQLQLSDYSRAIEYQEKALKIFDSIRYEYGCRVVISSWQRI